MPADRLAAYRKRPNTPGVQGAYERALEWLWTHRHDGEQYRTWIRQRVAVLRFLRGES